MGRDDTDEAQWYGRHDDKGQGKGPEPSHHEDIDDDKNGGESQSKVTEDLVGDMPLPVPFQG